MSNPKYIKSSPTIEKIELTEAQRADIKQIMSGELSKETIKNLESRGINIQNWLKHKRPESTANRIRTIKNKYFLGLCHICTGFPDYKITYQLDGIELLEFYCEKHKGFIKK
jgi:hypothetical protein